MSPSHLSRTLLKREELTEPRPGRRPGRAHSCHPRSPPRIAQLRAGGGFPRWCSRPLPKAPFFEARIGRELHLLPEHISPAGCLSASTRRSRACSCRRWPSRIILGVLRRDRVDSTGSTKSSSTATSISSSPRSATAAARATTLVESSSGRFTRAIDLSTVDPVLHPFNAGVVQHAIHLFMSAANRRAAAVPASTWARLRTSTCPRALRRRCPVAPR
jgi:hypothetical protein